MLLLLAALSLGLTDPLPTTQSAWRAVKAAGPPPRLPATDDEWKRVLEPMQYAVLREEATEPPWSSELNKVSEEGAFLCAGCGIPLFTTSAKFESGSGWPSFWAPADAEALALSTDFRAVLPRTETRCARCGGHLGHVFDDGPPPTGRRYCINGAAMEFESGTARADAAARGFDAAEAAPPPLTKVAAEFLLSSALALGLLYSFVVTSQAESGAAWAVEARAASGTWLFGAVKLVFGGPPGGPACLALIVLNVLGARQKLPLLRAAARRRRDEAP